LISGHLSRKFPSFCFNSRTLFVPDREHGGTGFSTS
jgi:hypothetical protein